MYNLFIADQQINAAEHDSTFQVECFESDGWDVRAENFDWDYFSCWHYGC